MSEPWTPGPWSIRKSSPIFILEVPSRDPETMAETDTVAEVFAKQDARLIALVPEMAELLSYFVEAYRPAEDEGVRYIRASQFVDEARALLARARGEI